MRGEVVPSPSPSLDATLSVPVELGVSGTRVGVDGAEDRGVGTGEVLGGKGDLGAEPGTAGAGSAMGLALIPYLCSVRKRHG